jgi:hypothetical protein
LKSQEACANVQKNSYNAKKIATILAILVIAECPQLVIRVSVNAPKFEANIVTCVLVYLKYSHHPQIV